MTPSAVPLPGFLYPEDTRAPDDDGADVLLRVLGSRYDLRVEQVLLAGRMFRIVAVSDSNALVDAIRPEDFALDERLPFWADLWTSALPLGEACLNDPSLAGEDVLELGCGLGLAGIAAAAAGARVTQTDYEPDALRFAECNARLNLPAGTIARTMAFRTLDWRAPDAYPPVDRIIGADITYERSLFQPLLRLMGRTLRPGGRAVLADPDRSIGRDFLALARESGFAVAAQSIPVERHGRTSSVTLATLRKLP